MSPALRSVSGSMGTHNNDSNRSFNVSCSVARAPAQSSATLTGENRITASDVLNSIHLDTMDASLPRETSMRMSESTRTVISDGTYQSGSHGAGFGHPPQRQVLMEEFSGFPRSPASPSCAVRDCPDNA